MHKTLYNISRGSAVKTCNFFSKGSHVFVEGGSPVPWHNGQYKPVRYDSIYCMRTVNDETTRCSTLTKLGSVAVERQRVYTIC